MYCSPGCKHINVNLSALHAAASEIAFTSAAARQFRRELWLIGNVASSVDQAARHRAATELKAARHRMGWSQTQLAAAASVPRYRISHFETARAELGRGSAVEGSALEGRGMSVRFDGCRLVRKTDRALLVDIESEEVWIPCSQVHDDSELWRESLDELAGAHKP